MPEQALPIGAVFLSYASQDAEAAARICEALRAVGVEVWLDRSELRGGDAWDAQIKKHIHDCAIFIPVISAHTNARSEGYFRREWKQATRRLQDMADDVAFLVPVVIDDTREVDARVPEEFLRAQWTWLPGGETPPAFANRQLLGGDSASVHTAKSAASAKIEPSGGVGYTRHRRASPVRLVAIALIALLVLGGGDYWFYQGARDAPSAKSAPATASPIAAAAPHEKSIAVLPFVNMSSDKEQEFFSDGLSEELLNLLAKVPDLRVAARTSSFYFKGKDVKLPDIARELRVAHLLEGSVRKSGNQVRITAQLIPISDGYHQWSETYDRALDDIFAVQEEIASAVVAQLKVKLLGTPPNARKTDPEAYALYLQTQQSDRQGRLNYEEAIALYQKVLEIDPNFAPAWFELSAQYAGQADEGLRPLGEGMELARNTMRKTLALGPAFAPAHAGLGWLALKYDHDLDAAAQHLEYALALEPTDIVTLGVASELSYALGRPENNIAVAEYILGRDPIASFAHGFLGYAYLNAGRLDDAIASYRVAMRLAPDSVGLRTAIADALLLKGEYEKAIADYQQVNSEPHRLFGLATAYHALGKKQQSDQALNELIKKHANWANFIACVYAFRNENDQAFDWLQKAAVERDSGLSNAAVSVWLANLHDDPRWPPFLRKLGKAPEQLAAIKFEMKVPGH